MVMMMKALVVAVAELLQSLQQILQWKSLLAAQLEWKLSEFPEW